MSKLRLYITVRAIQTVRCFRVKVAFFCEKTKLKSEIKFILQCKPCSEFPEPDYFPDISDGFGCARPCFIAANAGNFMQIGIIGR
jgi:hypothetical protein